jgi:hypothetical protein
LVADEFSGLLDESLHLPIRSCNHDTVLGGVSDFGQADGSLSAVLPMHPNELLQWEFTYDVTIEDEEEGIGVVAQ